MITPRTFISAISARFRKLRSRDVSAKSERALVYSLAPTRLPRLKQLRYLPKILSDSERLLVRGLVGFVVIALVFLGARVYARNVVHLPKSGGEIIEGVLGNPQYINPVLASTNDVDRDLTRLLFVGLMRRDEHGNIVTCLAESYTVSQDKKTYTFTLASDLTWSDGKPISADDVLMTFELIGDPLFKSPLRSQFRNVEIERVDERTLKFTLAQPNAAFLSRLTVGILPAHIWSDVTPPTFGLLEFNIKPIGAGPFMFDSLKRSSSGFIREYTLIRNPRYHGDRPYLDRLVFKMFQDEESLTAAIGSKSVDSVGAVAKERRASLKQVRLADLELQQYTAVFLNAKRTNLKTSEVRKALSAAIDREVIVRDVMRGAAAVVDGTFGSKMPGYAGKLQPSFSPDEANRVLENAGWKRVDNGVRKKGSDELKVTLTVVDDPDDLAIAEIIKRNWEAIGAIITINPVDAARIAKDVIKPRDFDAFLYGEILTPDGDLYPFWHSSQEIDPGLNLTRFFNKDADKLLDELRIETDPKIIAEKRIAFQRLFANDAHALFLFTPYYTYGLSKRVKGFDQAYVTMPADRFNGVAHWYVKTRISFKRD